MIVQLILKVHLPHPDRWQQNWQEGQQDVSQTVLRRGLIRQVKWKHLWDEPWVCRGFILFYWSLWQWICCFQINNITTFALLLQLVTPEVLFSNILRYHSPPLFKIKWSRCTVFWIYENKQYFKSISTFGILIKKNFCLVFIFHCKNALQKMSYQFTFSKTFHLTQRKGQIKLLALLMRLL